MITMMICHTFSNQLQVTYLAKRMGEKAQPATLARVTCSLVFSVALTLHIVYAQGGGKPDEVDAAGQPLKAKPTADDGQAEGK